METKEMINVMVNGKPRELSNPTDLVSFLGALGIDMQSIAVAYNGSVLPRDQLSGVTLFDGDSLEVVRIVGGG